MAVGELNVRIIELRVVLHVCPIHLGIEYLQPIFDVGEWKHLQICSSDIGVIFTEKIRVSRKPKEGSEISILAIQKGGSENEAEFVLDGEPYKVTRHSHRVPRASR
eukprot:TRINITY_DN12537_c0_g3_i1.p2 TRINITY_DN12537_c0_g3~~TRINITY_DN12537_c0_g3_i1.p2  ORF type:complete len:106 (-),score=10.50 TRINITY_DN12537_c0_g3_i1:188-505(-)